MFSSDGSHSDHPPPSPTTPGSEEAPLIPPAAALSPPPVPVPHPDAVARLTVVAGMNHQQQEQQEHAVCPVISRTTSHQSRTLSPIPASPQTSHPSSPRSSYHSTRDRPGSRRSPRTASPVEDPSRAPCHTPARDHDRRQCADARWIATMTRITSSKTHAVTGFNQTRRTHQQQHAADNTPTDGCTTCAELMAHRDTLLAELAGMDATLAEVEATIEKEVEETHRRLAPPTTPYAGSACSA